MLGFDHEYFTKHRSNIMKALVKYLAVGFLSFATMIANANDGVLKKDLYRSGNATTPRMENVRLERVPPDIETYTVKGVVWVKARTGGISTTETKPKTGQEKGWWKASAGTKVSPKLTVRNDKPNHWAWEPTVDMPLDDYISLLKEANKHFVKLK